jgi:LacI family transcriptional regulator
MSALREAGLRVPEDVAVVGFDDIPMAQYVSPGLTSVHVPIFEMGRRAIERLIEAVRSEGSPPRTREVLPTKLVVRASCGLN